MATTTSISSRHFNQETGKAKLAAERGPVIITDRGTPTHVLLTYHDFSQFKQKRVSLVDALSMPEDDVELELPERVPYIPFEIEW